MTQLTSSEKAERRDRLFQISIRVAASPAADVIAPDHMLFLPMKPMGYPDKTPDKASDHIVFLQILSHYLSMALPENKATIKIKTLLENFLVSNFSYLIPSLFIDRCPHPIVLPVGAPAMSITHRLRSGSI